MVCSLWSGSTEINLFIYKTTHSVVNCRPQHFLRCLNRYFGHTVGIFKAFGRFSVAPVTDCGFGMTHKTFTLLQPKSDCLTQVHFVTHSSLYQNTLYTNNINTCRIILLKWQVQTPHTNRNSRVNSNTGTDTRSDAGFRVAKCKKRHYRLSVMHQKAATRWNVPERLRRSVTSAVTERSGLRKSTKATICLQENTPVLRLKSKGLSAMTAGAGDMNVTSGGQRLLQWQ